MNFQHLTLKKKKLNVTVSKISNLKIFPISLIINLQYNNWLVCYN